MNHDLPTSLSSVFSCVASLSIFEIANSDWHQRLIFFKEAAIAEHISLPYNKNCVNRSNSRTAMYYGFRNLLARKLWVIKVFYANLQGSICEFYSLSASLNRGLFVDPLRPMTNLNAKTPNCDLHLKKIFAVPVPARFLVNKSQKVERI